MKGKGRRIADVMRSCKKEGEAKQQADNLWAKVVFLLYSANHFARHTRNVAQRTLPGNVACPKTLSPAPLAFPDEGIRGGACLSAHNGYLRVISKSHMARKRTGQGRGQEERGAVWHQSLGQSKDAIKNASRAAIYKTRMHMYWSPYVYRRTPHTHTQWGTHTHTWIDSYIA